MEMYSGLLTPLPSPVRRMRVRKPCNATDMSRAAPAPPPAHCAVTDQPTGPLER